MAVLLAKAPTIEAADALTAEMLADLKIEKIK